MKEQVVEPVVEEVSQPVVIEEPPKKVDKLKEVAQCPDCNQFMTVHTLKYIHKRRGFCKADIKPEVVPEPIVQPKKKIVTEAAVNEYKRKSSYC